MSLSYFNAFISDLTNIKAIKVIGKTKSSPKTKKAKYTKYKDSCIIENEVSFEKYIQFAFLVPAKSKLQKNNNSDPLNK